MRARLRVITNVAVGAGSAAATGALAVGTPADYVTAMLTASALVLASAIPLRGLPAPAGASTAAMPSRPARPSRSPLRDLRYVGIAALHGVLTIQFGLLTVRMPLWVTLHTRAPAPTVAPLRSGRVVARLRTGRRP